MLTVALEVVAEVVVGEVAAGDVCVDVVGVDAVDAVGLHGGVVQSPASGLLWL